MTREAARILADAIRGAHRRHDERRGRHVARGTITALEPLEVDLHGSDLTLDADDIAFSRAVADEDLEVGDVLVLSEVDEGDWIAVAIE